MANVAQGGDRRMASHKVVSLPPCCSISTQMTSPYTQIQGVSCMLMTSALQSLWKWKSLANALAGLTDYYATNHLQAIPEKTQISAFHLKNRDANKERNVHWYGRRLLHISKPVYLRVTMDRTPSHIAHAIKTKAEVGARNNILKKLANTKWGTRPAIIKEHCSCHVLFSSWVCLPSVESLISCQEDGYSP